MNLLPRTLTVVTAELVLFSAILTVLWMDEFLDFPYRVLGATPTPFRPEEFIVESTFCCIVALIVIIGTLLFFRRLDKLEQYLRVCAWCRKVWLGDRWVTFEEYLLIKHTLKSSHSICPECHQKTNIDIQEIQAGEKKNCR